MNFPRMNGTPKFLLDVTCQSQCHLPHIQVELTLLSFRLRVAGSDFGIRLGEELINPPFVCLISTATRPWGINSVVA